MAGTRHAIRKLTRSLVPILGLPMTIVEAVLILSRGVPIPSVRCAALADRPGVVELDIQSRDPDANCPEVRRVVASRTGPVRRKEVVCSN